MARTKILLLLTLLAVIPAVSAFQFNVKVAGTADASTYDIEYMNETNVIHEMNVTVENPASAGCNYYLEGNYRKGGETERIYSNAYKMWPGESERMQIHYLPLDYNGTVQADIDLLYCGIQKNLTSFEFNATQLNEADTDVESDTVKVKRNNAEINLPVTEGHLIPSETPAYWKVGRAEIANRTSKIRYEPTIFKEEKQIKYTVVDGEGEILGTTTVELTEPEPTLKEKLLNNKWLIFAGLFVASLIGNAYLLRKKIVPEKVREKLAELEMGDRSIKK
jgi:hypothetical protein